MADRPTHRPGLVLLLLAAAQGLAVGSSSIVSVALPTIGPALRASETQQQWIVDAYVLIYASLLVAGGVLGDRYGRRRAFLGGLALFVLGSLVCTLAPSTGVLLGGRVLQGLGPPLVQPASLALVAAAYPEPAERGRAIGLWAVGSGLGLTLGPLLGGALVDLSGWRAVFALTAVLGAFIGLVGTRVVPYVVPAAARERFDVLGAVLTTVALGATAFAIIEARDRGVTSAWILGAVVLAVAAGVAFVRWERTRREPLVDVALLREPVFMAANVGAAAVFFALIGATVYLATFLQLVQGRSAVAAGVLLLPLGAGVALASPVAGRLVARIGPRGPMTAGLLLAAVGCLALLTLDAETPALAMAGPFLLLGLGTGMALPPATATAVSAVTGDRIGMASAIHNALRQLGQALGVAVLGAIVLTGGSHGSYTAGLHVALVVSAGVLVAGAALVLWLVPARTPAG